MKGRDWYDLIWYVGNYPDLRLKHLEQRMVQTEDWPSASPLTESAFKERLIERINTLDINKIRKEVEPSVRAPEDLVICVSGHKTMNRKIYCSFLFSYFHVRHSTTNAL